ncbi:MAG: RibD family protein, partial [Planctomycetota bacterium]
DPNPATRGLGLRHLQRQGVAVTAGTCEAEARELLAPYLRLTTAGVPLVTAKWAMTADGRTASISGDGRWISSGITRRRTRRERGTVDAILIGRGTAEADDPQLTCRTRGLPDPLRVVLDTKLKLDSWSALVRTISRAPLLLAAAASLEGDAGFEERKGRLEEAGAEMVSLPAGPGGVHLGALLEHLGGRGIANLLVEGGMGVVGSFLDAGLVDRVQVILAPKLSWGENAPAPAGGKGVPSMREALPIHNLQTRKSAGDLILEGSLTAAGRGEWSEPSS